MRFIFDKDDLSSLVHTVHILAPTAVNVVKNRSGECGSPLERTLLLGWSCVSSPKS